jgi:hypothetical protein
MFYRLSKNVFLKPAKAEFGQKNGTPIGKNPIKAPENSGIHEYATAPYCREQCPAHYLKSSKKESPSKKVHSKPITPIVRLL